MESRGAGPTNGADNRVMLAIFFPVHQYLGDAALRKIVVDIARSERMDPADARVLNSFHPIAKEGLKQLRDVDVYGLLGMSGRLIRTHLVLTNGVARTNPPPEGYLCDSCHRKGWLMKRYQDSKIDGANIPVWLCPDCMRLKPEERDVRF